MSTTMNGIGMKKNRLARGFTLIELMIVVAIVAILASIAYPAYTDSVLKGKRTQARTALLDLMQQQERYMTQRNTYLDFTTSNTGALSAASTSPLPNPLPFRNYTGENPTTPAYWISAMVCSSSQSLQECIKLTANPTKPDSAVGAITLTSAGAKSCSGTTDMKLCWP